MKFFHLVPRQLILKLIRWYQKTLSFDYGAGRFLFPYGYCRFHPTCSQYGYEAVATYGVWRGGLMAAARILRCHPWSQGGYDPVKFRD